MILNKRKSSYYNNRKIFMSSKYFIRLGILQDLSKIKISLNRYCIIPFGI